METLCAVFFHRRQGDQESFWFFVTDLVVRRSSRRSTCSVTAFESPFRGGARDGMRPQSPPRHRAERVAHRPATPADRTAFEDRRKHKPMARAACVSAGLRTPCRRYAAACDASVFAACALISVTPSLCGQTVRADDSKNRFSRCALLGVLGALCGDSAAL